MRSVFQKLPRRWPERTCRSSAVAQTRPSPSGGSGSAGHCGLCQPLSPEEGSWGESSGLSKGRGRALRRWPQQAGKMKGSRIDLGAMTTHNIKQLKRLNQVIFPVSYNKFYKDVLEVGELSVQCAAAWLIHRNRRRRT